MQYEVIFRVKRWGDEVYRSSQTYGHIRTFFDDNKVLQEYISSQVPIRLAEDSDGRLCFLYDDGRLEPYPDDDNDDYVSTPHNISISKEDITINLQEAKQFYNRQMVVVTATYIELILKDFLQSIFCKFPERMHNYLDDGNGYKGLVSLKLITKADSLPELILELSEQAASNVLKGRFKAQLNSLARVVPEEEISQQLQGQLIDIVEKRNRIVHEASKEQILDDDVRKFLDIDFELLNSLANIAIKCNIALDIPSDVEGF